MNEHGFLGKNFAFSSPPKNVWPHLSFSVLQRISLRPRTGWDMSNNEVPDAEKREGSWAVLGVLKQLMRGLRRWKRREGWTAVEGRSDRCLWWFQETQDENKSQKTGRMWEGGKGNELRAAVYLIKHSPVQMESCIMPQQSPLEHWENGKEWIALLDRGGGLRFLPKLED